MSQLQPNCPACRERMEEGFVLDQAHGPSSESKWIGGKPQKSFWGSVKLTGRAQHPVVAFRCPRCGLLVQYAPST